jgi:hypothetical protein
MPPSFLPALLALALWAPAQGHAQWFGEVRAGYEFDSNLSRAQRAADIKPDSALSASASLGRGFDTGNNTSAALFVDLKSTGQLRYTGLSHNDVGVGASIRHKFGLGPYAPWTSASVGATRTVYRDDLRSGWLYDAALSAGMRHTALWDSTIELRHDRRTTDAERRVVPNFSGAVYEVAGWTGRLGSNLDLGERLRLSAGYAQRIGDITSTAVHTQQIWDASTAWNKDAGLGGDGYRIRARTHILTLGASIALGTDASINLGVDRWLSRANGGFDYYNTLVRAQFMLRLP